MNYLLNRKKEKKKPQRTITLVVCIFPSYFSNIWKPFSFSSKTAHGKGKYRDRDSGKVCQDMVFDDINKHMTARWLSCPVPILKIKTREKMDKYFNYLNYNKICLNKIYHEYY